MTAARFIPLNLRGLTYKKFELLTTQSMRFKMPPCLT
jgi:hypothetical protein